MNTVSQFNSPFIIAGERFNTVTCFLKHDTSDEVGYDVVQSLHQHITVNQLDFAAVKFCGLPIFLYFTHFNFAFCYLRIYPVKNVASQKCL